MKECGSEITSSRPTLRIAPCVMHGSYLAEQLPGAAKLVSSLKKVICSAQTKSNHPQSSTVNLSDGNRSSVESLV
jgi:hypothetical protein